MRIPLSWVREYAPIADGDATAAEVSQRLTAAGLEVESAEQVGHDGAGHDVLVTGRGADDHRAALPAPAGKLRPHPPDDPQGHHRGPVFLGDGYRAGRPVGPHLAQHGDQQVKIGPGRVHP